MPSRLRGPVAVVVAALLASAAVGAAAAADTSARSATGPSVGPTAGGTGQPTDCFAGAGYPISIGETGAVVEAVVHLSVLTDPAAGDEFGIEAAGTLDGDPIVTLAAGVRFTGREAVANGVDPFAAFDVLYTYELRLPMFDGTVDDADYEDDGSPIDAGAGAATC